MTGFTTNFYAQGPVNSSQTPGQPVNQAFSQFTKTPVTPPVQTANIPPKAALAPDKASIQNENEAKIKKLKNINIAAVSLTALSLATAGFCLYRTGKTKNALNALQNTVNTSQSALLKAQQDLLNAKNAAAAFQKNHQKMINRLLFPNGIGNLNFNQSNIGDCYLLSPVYGLSRNPAGRKILQNMVTITPDGNFAVKFHNMNPIIVTPSQIKGQTISQKGVRRTVYGDMGVQAIECAYGKYRRALSVKNGLNNASLLAIDSGSPDEALRVLGGLSSTNHGRLRNGTLKSQNIDVTSILDNIADNFNSRIVNAATPDATFAPVQKTLKNGTVRGWMDTTQMMPCHHAYNIQAIDKANKTVKVVNPHCTTSSVTLSYEDFAKVFGKIYETAI